nr:MAG TPA: hypothetical protein [Caudoviricetes sp.]
MKQYTGTKTVKAEPMSMGEAFAKKLLKKDIKLSDVKKWKAGYLVEYEGGYQSWSPADVFEKNYKLSETYLDRLKTEYDEIAERLEKLQDYLNKYDTLEKVGYTQFTLLIQQSICMNEYKEIIAFRLRNLSAK